MLWNEGRVLLGGQTANGSRIGCVGLGVECDGVARRNLGLLLRGRLSLVAGFSCLMEAGSPPLKTLGGGQSRFRAVSHENPGEQSEFWTTGQWNLGPEYNKGRLTNNFLVGQTPLYCVDAGALTLLRRRA